MSAKDDLQTQSIQLDVINPQDPTALEQLIEWAKQASAKQKALQVEIDKINDWLFPD